MGVAFADVIGLEAGAGVTKGGPQLSGMVRGALRLSPRFALSLGSGVSLGPWAKMHVESPFEHTFDFDRHSYDTGPPPDERAELATWWNLELAAEFGPATGLRSRIYAGYARAISMKGCTTDGAPHACHVTFSNPSDVAYLGLALIYAFQL